MQFSNAVFENPEHTLITANVDGVVKTFPTLTNNKHFREMVKHEIDVADYVEPPEVTFPPLTRFQFSVALNLMGIDTSKLKAAVSAVIQDPLQKAVALAAIENPPGDTYNRDNALFAHPDILAALGLTAAQIDTTWKQVKSIESV